MHRPSIILAVVVAVTIAGVNAEYIWTGTEWKWQEPSTSSSSGNSGTQTQLGSNTDILDSNSEGSGDNWDDDDSYDEDYDYDGFEVSKQNNKKYDFNDYGKNTKKEKKQKEKKDRNKNRDSQFFPSNANSAILPATDDEDLFDGSGEDDDLYVSPDNSNNNNNNNNFNFNNPITESPTNKFNNNQNEYFGPDDDDYDDYNYDDYEEEEDDDITFVDNMNNLPKPTDPIHNIYKPTTSTTIRSFTTKPTTTQRPDTGAGREAHNPIPVNRPASFFAQPGILAAVIGGAVVGLLCAILLVMFIVYRMRKKDEGSYALDDSKRSHNVNSYSKPPNREFYA